MKGKLENEYSVIFFRDHTKLGNFYYEPILSHEFPKRLSFGILREIIRSDRSVDIYMKIRPVEDDKILKILDWEVEKIEGEINDYRGWISRAKKLEYKLESAKALEEYILAGKGRIFSFSIAFFPKGKNKKESKTLANEISYILRKHLFLPARAIFSQKKVMFNLFPVGRDFIQNSRYIQSHGVSLFFPFLTDYIEMRDGIFIGINDKNLTPVIFNRWEFPSSHSVIAGTTGFGKSYFVKLTLIRELINNPETNIYIIDPMGEYSRLVRALDGTVVHVGERGSEINPLDLYSNASLSEKIVSLKNILSITMDLGKSDLAIIDAALTSLYSRKSKPVLGDLVETLEKFEDDRSKRIAFYLEKLVNGSLKNLNSQTKINLSKKVVSFDLTNVKDEFLTLYMVIILDFIYSMVTKNFERKIVVVDEAWKLLSNDYSALYLETMYRHVRRWKCSMNIISHKIDEFLESVRGRNILNNSLIHAIFKHANISMEMKNFYKLTKVEEDYVLNAKKPKENGYSQALFISFPYRIPLRIYGTDKENELITTDPDEMREILLINKVK